MKNNSQGYIEKRLEDWADWYLRGCDFGTGYPRKTIEARLHDEGGVLIKSTGPGCPLTNLDAEEIEKLVSLELAQQSPRLAKVLRAHYLKPGTMEQKAQRLSMSYSRYKVQLDLARQWMVGRLSG